jgi:glycosyltransferase involved in cell wall biosynthesis
MSIEKFGRNFNPFVSIVIPVYNGSNYVREAIDSALAQTYKNIEIIVVNDGSTDNTEEIVKSYGNKLRYFKKKNGGVSTALNLGIEKSKGEYISWLSHDDVYYPNKIEKQVNELTKLNKNKRDKTILYSNWVLIDKNSRIFDKFRIEKKYDIKKLNYPLYPVLNCITHGCVLLIPKRCFDEVGLFDPKLKTTQDYDLWFKMFPKYDLKFMPNFFVKFRYHEQQGSNTNSGTKKENEIFWMKMLKTLTDEEKIKIGDSLTCFYKKMIRFANESDYIDTEKYLINCLSRIGGRVNKSEELFIKTRERIKNKIRRIFFRVF